MAVTSVQLILLVWLLSLIHIVVSASYINSSKPLVIPILSCFECNHMEHPGCLDPDPDTSPSKQCQQGELCTKQVQEESDDQHYAVQRGCYLPGTKSGLNASIGCRHWTNPSGYKALYCFCDKNYCNGSTQSKPASTVVILVLSLASIVFSFHSRTVLTSISCLKKLL